MSNLKLTIIMSMLIALFPSLSSAASLKDLQFSTLPGDKVEVRLKFDGEPPKVDGYTIDQPARIAIDLPSVKSALPKKYYALGYGNARSLTVVEAQGRTRLIVGLSKLVPYNTRVDGNTLILLVGANSAMAAASDASGVAPANNQKSADKSIGAPNVTSGPIAKVNSSGSNFGVRNIDFTRGDGGEGNVVISLADAHTPVDVSQSGNKIKVTLAKTKLPDNLKRRLEVGDFATPVKFIDTLSEDGNTVITIEADGSYEQMAYQTDNEFTVSIKPVSEDELAKKKKDSFQYEGDKLSLNFQDIEVRSVLQLIADFTGLNLVASDTVTGKITLRLQNVPWDQALDLVLKTKGLDKRKIGNVLMVGPAEEIAAREKQEIETNKQVAELAPLKSDVIKLRYAKAANIAALLGTGSSGSPAAEAAAPAAGAAATAAAAEPTTGSKLLSSRGSAIVDERTNTVLVTDTAEKLEEIHRVIDILDIPIRQVLIESRIVLATTNFAKELGVAWGGVSDGRAGGGWGFGGGSTTGFDNTNDGDPTTADGANDLSLNKVVNLGVNEPAGSLTLGFVKNSTLLHLQLSALETDAQGEVVSQPKIITADQTKATITSGVEIGYLTASASKTDVPIVNFKTALLIMEVTPHITPDDKVMMELKVTNDQVGTIVAGIPSLDKNAVETQALVRNGETVVLGGIYRTEVSDTVTKVPFFGDIPVLGKLFTNKLKKTSKRELLIFITPRIIKDELTGK